MSLLRTGWWILRYLGPRIVWLRAGVYAGRMLGTTRRAFKPRPWERIELEEILRPGIPTSPADYGAWKAAHAPAFLFPLGAAPTVPPELREVAGGVEPRRPALPDRLRLLQEGRCVYFFRLPSPAPIDWYSNPFDGRRAIADRVWCDIPDYLPEQGDPRTLWEPARAAWAIDLARAASHGIELPAGDIFWQWLESWMRSCPPYLGFHWKCGQEASVRLIACTLAFWSLAADPATTPARYVQFARLAWATGYRVAKHIRYAISQKNNHAISESCGLMLVGHLFPELRQAQRWWRLGYRVLARELRRQIYPDGSYVQHSMNYQRVMLDAATLAFRLAELHGQPFPRQLYELLSRCADFLHHLTDPDSGRVPLYGNNDGAWVLPLTECDFGDFRPVIQTVSYLVHRRRRFGPGPWDEPLLWLFGPTALQARVEPLPTGSCTAFHPGGYYVLRQRKSWAMLRCHCYRDRPGQYDQLHLDLWYRGINVLRDCGSYQYYVPGRPDLEHYFKSIAAHNCIRVDGADPVRFVSRFLFFPWPRGRLRRFEKLAGGLCCLEAEHYDYDRPPWNVRHRRAVLMGPADLWVIIDDLLGAGTHAFTLRWHLAEQECELLEARGAESLPSSVSLRLNTPAGAIGLSITGWPRGPEGIELVRGRTQAKAVGGLAAPYYAELRAIPTLELSWQVLLPARVVTVLSAQAFVAAELAGEGTPGQLCRLARPGATPILTLELGPLVRTADRMVSACRLAGGALD
jgi:hypothetical protein